MKLAILGNGHIGAGLARAWAGKGHQVVFGTRRPDSDEMRELCTKLSGGVDGRVSAASMATAVTDAVVVTLAVPFGVVTEVLGATGPLDGKIVIDCTNAVTRGPLGMSLVYGHTTSAAEEIQKLLPKAHVFKSFNAQGAENLANPIYEGVPAVNFFCGDDAAGRSVVQGLVRDVGFEPVDAGPLVNARLLEPMMLLWMASSRAFGTRDIAFNVLRR